MWMDIVTHILNFEMWVGAHLGTWAAYGGWAVGVTAVLQYIKRKYEIDKAKGFSFLGLWRMDGPRIMATVYALIAAASAWLSQYMSPTVSETDRLTMLVALGAAAHRFIVSPAGEKLAKKLAPYLTALQQLRTVEQGIVASNNSLAPLAMPMDATIETSTPITAAASPSVIGSVVNPNDTSGR